MLIRFRAKKNDEVEKGVKKRGEKKGKKSETKERGGGEQVKNRDGNGYRETVVCSSLVCLCLCFLPIHSGHQVRWTYQPGSHRRKVTSSTFFLRCVP